MTYNIIGISPGHNGSVCLLKDGKIDTYIEEERITRYKYDGNPIRGLQELLKNNRVDELALGGIGDISYTETNWTCTNFFSDYVRKHKVGSKVDTMYFTAHHHLCHAALAYYNSGFDKALAIVADGCGSYVKLENMRTAWFNNDLTTPIEGYETESAWVFNSLSQIEPVKRHLGYDNAKYFNDGITLVDNSTNITKTYEAVTSYLGFANIDAGKTMGLAPYGKDNPMFKDLYTNNRGNKEYFIPYYPHGAELVYDALPGLPFNPTYKECIEWHTDASKLEQEKKDLAFAVQKNSQIALGNFIEENIKKTGITNVVLSGGYALNCVANYYLVKRFPDVKFYVEPIAHDGGISIGAALLAWGSYCKKNNIPLNNTKQEKIYYGFTYNKQEIINAIESDDDFEKVSITPSEVAQLIADRNIVTIYQGRSEAGPRALGNRSILYDPRDPNGKDYVNKVKNREWFRPFAGSVLKEYAHEWFDLAGMDESPFMMYAVDIRPEKIAQIPNIAHVDNTCRVQTVTPEQNYHYYNLIKEFHSITGVPVLFNTSFNLAGDPLVETIYDALDTLKRSDLKYLYLPELNILLKKKGP